MHGFSFALFSSGRRSRTSLQTRQHLNKSSVIFLAVVLRRLNGGEHPTNRVHHGQQPAGDFGAQGELGFAQFGKQAFARVRQLLQARKA
jgi:hypothetical protein